MKTIARRERVSVADVVGLVVFISNIVVERPGEYINSCRNDRLHLYDGRVWQKEVGVPVFGGIDSVFHLQVLDTSGEAFSRHRGRCAGQHFLA